MSRDRRDGGSFGATGRRRFYNLPSPTDQGAARTPRRSARVHPQVAGKTYMPAPDAVWHET